MEINNERLANFVERRLGKKNEVNFVTAAKCGGRRPGAPDRRGVSSPAQGPKKSR